MDAETRCCRIFEAILEHFTGDMTRQAFIDWLAEPTQLSFVAAIGETRPDLVDHLRRRCSAILKHLPREGLTE